MNIRDVGVVDRILKHPQLSHVDFREVEMLGNDAFDYVRDILSKTPGSRATINGLKLLMHLARQAAQDSSGPRLPEVFDVASRFVGDPDLDVRTIAARILVGTLALLKTLGKGPEAVGGVAHVLGVVRRSLSAGPRAVERRMVEEILTNVEGQS
jgi:hypothetical protein